VLPSAERLAFWRLVNVCPVRMLALTIVVVPSWRSRRKMSVPTQMLPGTRLLSALWKVTKRPSAEMEQLLAADVAACWPLAPRLTRVVWPVWRSWQKMSSRPLVSPATRLVAKLSKTTNRPSAER
jgi:hypothetical protein